MATPVFSPSSFATGELAPALYGHADLQRNHAGAATMRNMFPRITGGAYSRAGTKFIAVSLQNGQPYPPRLIPFQFSILQGRILEFADFGMRVIANGALVTDGSLYTSAATNTNPLTVTIESSGGSAATPINGGVTSSYAPGEIVGLEGGHFTIPGYVQIDNTILLSITPQVGTGSGYAPADTLTLNGGTTSPQLLISATTANTASIVNAGTGGTPGLATITGTTGSGTPFTAQVLIGSGGTITSLQTLSSGGVYNGNPTNPAVEPVTGGGLTGATVKLTMGPLFATIVHSGVFSTNPGNTMTQLSSSGAGTGAVFINPLMGAGAVSISQEGAYTVFPPDPTPQYDTTGSGLGIMFHMGWAGGASSYNEGDWINFAGIGGMTELNGQTLIISNVSGNVFSFIDTCGNNVDATAWGVYTSAGTASRIMVVHSPYAQEDLKWLKYTQSADVMSLCCVNQESLVEYPPYDLKRHSDTNWEFVQVDFATTISPPGAVNVTGSYNWALNSFNDMSDYPNPLTASYAYCVTAINPVDGTESVSSPVNGILGAVDIASNQGSITVTWSPVGPVGGSGATKQPVQSYNIYKATPASAWGYYPGPIPIGVLFGFAAQSFGTQWIDQNVVADFSQTPPLHVNPFARGAITAVNVAYGGSGYVGSNTFVQVNTTTGSGAVIEPVILNGGYGDASGGFDDPAQHSGPIVAYIIKDGGQNYASTDTITIISAVTADTALAAPVVGPQTGTYPSVPSYYQQRRIYAGTLNDPDTYWMSVVGSYLNMNTRIPTIDSDAIQGTPWTLQVNGIQWMVPMPGGVMTFTGNSAWIVGGPGSSPINPLPITPANQQAQPMVFNGASPTVPPVRIEGDLVYLQSKGTIYRDLTLLNYFVNYYTGQDITVNSPHLFLGYNIQEHAWCEEPYKLLWSVRDDGALLSMTYYKPEKVLGWARHDTFGKVLTVASVIEPPVDALYMAVLRPICVNGGCSICLERMDNRLWNDVQGVWAVDCALAYPQPEPYAILQISAPDGDGAVVGVINLVAGQNYSPSTSAYVVDDNGLGNGSGAVIAITISGGVITTISVTAPGAGYSNPALVVEDPTGQGSGASGVLVLETSAVFITSDPVFSPETVGSVIRAAGGMATVSAYVNPQEVIGNFIIPMSSFMPELNQGLYLPNIPFGSWTMTVPAQVIGGLWHLVGQSVTGLADGEVIPPRIVNDKGEVVLDAPATEIVIGLGFTAQLQSMYVDVGEPTAQGQRKKVGAVTARVDASRDFLIGANQIDGSTLSPQQLGPTWTNMEPAPNVGHAPYQAETLIQAPVPLWTGDVRIPVINGVGKPGQVALMQDNPLPLNVLSIIPEIMSGDVPEQQAKPRQKGKPQQ